LASHGLARLDFALTTSVCLFLNDIFLFLFAAWYSIVVVCLVLSLLIKDFFPPHFVLTMGLALVMIAEVITIPEALIGFSNSGSQFFSFLFFCGVVSRFFS